jgi:hypothetical protein
MESIVRGIGFPAQGGSFQGRVKGHAASHSLKQPLAYFPGFGLVLSMVRCSHFQP